MRNFLCRTTFSESRCPFRIFPKVYKVKCQTRGCILERACIWERVIRVIFIPPWGTAKRMAWTILQANLWWMRKETLWWWWQYWVVLGGWGNSSGPQHKGCMCEVINLRDLRRVFFFPTAFQPTHSFWLWARRFPADGLWHRKERMVSETFWACWCSQHFCTYS